MKQHRNKAEAPGQRSERTDRASIDASNRNEAGCKPFDELPPAWVGLVLVAVELLLCVGALAFPLEGVAVETTVALPTPPDPIFVLSRVWIVVGTVNVGETWVVLLTPPGTVCVLSGAWLVTGTVNVGVGAVVVATAPVGVAVVTTTLCVTAPGITVFVFVLGALLSISGSAG